MLDQKAAEVGGVMPVGTGQQGPQPGHEPRRRAHRRLRREGVQAGQVPADRDFPAQGRPAVDPPRPHRGRHGIGHAASRSASCAATSPCRSARPSASSAPRPSRRPCPVAIARGDIQADSDRNGIVTRQDLFNSAYGWSAGNAAGDVDSNGRVDVSDLQTVSRGEAGAQGAAAPRRRSPLTFIVNTTDDARRRDAGRPDLRHRRRPLHAARRASTRPTATAGPTPSTSPSRAAPPGDPALRSASSSSTSRAPRSTATRSPARTPNTDPINDNALPGIEIRGNGDAAKEAIFITNTDTTIRGLALNRMWKTIWMSTGSAQHDHRRQLHRHDAHGREHRLQRRRRRADGRRLARQPDRPADARPAAT